MTHNEISSIVIDVALDIHRKLGPGLLENVYQEIMVYELQKRDLQVDKEVAVTVKWEDVTIGSGFKADLLVEDKVIVELKSIEKLAPVHKKQLLTYLRLADKRLGLLINFGEELLKDGLVRLVNKLEE